MDRLLDEQLCDPINLRWAWEKVRRQSRPGDHWHDEIALCEFELNLDDNLEDLGRALRRRAYKMEPLHPLPFPKSPSSDGTLRTRQSFEVSVRDQVVWTALVNVVGPHCDVEMPSWSYGNRLFRSSWVETLPTGRTVLKFGRYRHTSGHLYRKFRQSWPRFRRHIALTARKMAGLADPMLLERGELETQELERDLPQSIRCRYLHQTWRPPGIVDTLYWASVDLEKFYPSVRLEHVKTGLLAHSPPAFRGGLSELLAALLDFELDTREWTAQELHEVGLRRKMKRLEGLPTGLFVSGFLANVAMLEIDREVDRRLQRAQVAHFRFVDDHVVLAYSVEELVRWIADYEMLLSQSHSGLRINPSKIEPAEVGDLLRRKDLRLATDMSAGRGRRWDNARRASAIDPKFPAPLITTTLGLLSEIGQMSIDLLDESERAHLFEQLEQLLLATFPATEIKDQTRVGFAAARLCELAQTAERDSEYLLEASDTSSSAVEARQGPDRPLSEADQRKLTEISAKRVFQLLLKAVRDSPDRLRLLVRAARFCRVAGLAGGATDLYDAVARAGGRRITDSSCEYLRAVLHQTFAEEVREAFLVEGDELRPTVDRDNARRFLADFRTVFSKQEFQDYPRFQFVRKSRKLLSFAGWAAGIGPSDDRGWERLLKPANGHPFPIRMDRSGQSPAIYQWFLERKGILNLRVSPTSLLARTLAFSSVDDPFAWSLLAFFPRYLPERFRGAVRSTSDSLPLRATELLGNRGWRGEALGNSEALEQASEERESATENPRVEGAVSLPGWCRFLREAVLSHPFDIRASEWTALEIARQIAKIRFGGPTQLEFLTSGAVEEHRTHPQNFFVPIEWTEGTPPVSWDAWKSTIASHPIRAAPLASQVLDSRYDKDPSLMDRSDSLWLFAEEWVELRGLGLVLLGLLRRSFSLPALWNGSGHLTMLRASWGIALQDLECSSMSLALLEGLLAARPLETRFLKKHPMLSIGEVDTKFDPPVFIDHQDVLKFLESAQHILGDYQTSVSSEAPRQLSPIKLEQLTWPQWGASDEA
ncbi:MAG: RNA-directed DNA polymerase [Thermoanaerobaculia bacterium]